MNKVKKFLINLLMTSFAIFVFISNLFEVNAAVTMKSMEKQADSFIKAGSESYDANLTNTVTGDFVGLGSILTMVGAGVMVAVMAYMGIKYMVSPPDKQAALKQQLIGVVAAGIVIFGAYGIWKAVIGVVKKF